MDCTYSTDKEANVLLTAGHANVQAIETGCTWVIYTGFILGSIILGDSRISNFPNVETWNDFAVGVGVGHRCVHCILALKSLELRKQIKRVRSNNWKPNMKLHCPFHVATMHEHMEFLERRR